MPELQELLNIRPERIKESAFNRALELMQARSKKYACIDDIKADPLICLFLEKTRLYKEFKSHDNIFLIDMSEIQIVESHRQAHALFKQFFEILAAIQNEEAVEAAGPEAKEAPQEGDRGLMQRIEEAQRKVNDQVSKFWQTYQWSPLSSKKMFIENYFSDWNECRKKPERDRHQCYQCFLKFGEGGLKFYQEKLHTFLKEMQYEGNKFMVDVNVYAVNFVLAYALLTSPKNWDPLFSEVLITVIQLIKNIRSSDQASPEQSSIVDAYSDQLIAEFECLIHIQQHFQSPEDHALPELCNFPMPANLEGIKHPHAAGFVAINRTAQKADKTFFSVFFADGIFADITRYFKSPDFSGFLDFFESQEKVAVFATIQGKILEWYRNNLEALIALDKFNPEERSIIFENIKANLPDRFQRATDLQYLKHLNNEELRYVFRSFLRILNRFFRAENNMDFVKIKIAVFVNALQHDCRCIFVDEFITAYQAQRGQALFPSLRTNFLENLIRGQANREEPYNQAHSSADMSGILDHWINNPDSRTAQAMVMAFGNDEEAKEEPNPEQFSERFGR